VTALSSGEATSVGDIGQALRAGTNCGSCLPELRRIVARQAAASENIKSESVVREDLAQTI
jgi:assimilatory nitrate reductase catalytic subunit